MSQQGEWENFKNLGAGVGESLRDEYYRQYLAGSTRFAGLPDAALQILKAVGPGLSRDDVVAIVEEQNREKQGKAGPAFQQAMNAIVQRWKTKREEEEKQRQELAAAQNLLRNNPTPAPLDTPELGEPAPVAGDSGGTGAAPAPPAANTAMPTVTALGQAGTDTPAPTAPQPAEASAEAAAQAPELGTPAPIGGDLQAPSTLDGGQSLQTLGVPAQLGTLSTDSGGALPPGGAASFDTGPVPAPAGPGQTTDALYATPGSAPPEAPAGGAAPPSAPVQAPAPVQGPGTPKLSAPAPLQGLLSGLAGHFAGHLGGMALPGGLTPDRLLGFAGLPSVGNLASGAAQQLLGGGDMDWTKLLGGGGGEGAAGGAGLAGDGSDGGGSRDVVERLDKIIELLGKLVDRETRTDQLGPQDDGSFRPSLGGAARQALNTGVQAAGAGITDSISGTASADTSAMVSQAVMRALTMAVAVA